MATDIASLRRSLKAQLLTEVLNKITDFMSCVSKVLGLREGKEAERRKERKEEGKERQMRGRKE